MPTLFLLALIIIAFIVQRWSMKNALKGVEYHCEPSRRLAASGEIFELITTLTNRSFRFIPFIQMTEALPKTAVVHSAGAVVDRSYYSGEAGHVSKVYLMPRSRLVRHVPISIPDRGRYLFMWAVLRGGDFLGLSENYEKLKNSNFNEVVIYPQAAAGDYVSEVVGGFLGDLSVRRFIIEDPVLTVGFKEYTGREPMKAISWPQSARAGRMMVKSFDYTTELSVSVVLNVEISGASETSEFAESTKPVESTEFAGSIEITESSEKASRLILIENCLSITHTVCRILEDRKIKYDFFSNIVALGSLGRWDYIGEGLGQGHFQIILEGLGRASYAASEPFEVLMERVMGKQTDARSIIFITAGSEAEVRALLKGRDEGRGVVISGERIVGA